MSDDSPEHTPPVRKVQIRRQRDPEPDSRNTLKRPRIEEDNPSTQDSSETDLTSTPPIRKKRPLPPRRIPGPSESDRAFEVSF